MRKRRKGLLEQLIAKFLHEAEMGTSSKKMRPHMRSKREQKCRVSVFRRA